MHILIKELPSGKLKVLLHGSCKECYDYLADRNLIGRDGYFVEDVRNPTDENILREVSDQYIPI